MCHALTVQMKIQQGDYTYSRFTHLHLLHGNIFQVDVWLYGSHFMTFCSLQNEMGPQNINSQCNNISVNVYFEGLVWALSNVCLCYDPTVERFTREHSIFVVVAAVCWNSG